MMTLRFSSPARLTGCTHYSCSQQGDTAHQCHLCRLSSRAPPGWLWGHSPWCKCQFIPISNLPASLWRRRLCLSTVRWINRTTTMRGKLWGLCSDCVQMTHPSPAGSTSADAAPPQTPPPQWACAGKCLHTASRSNCSPACTCERSAAPYSRPAETATITMGSLFFSVFLFFNSSLHDVDSIDIISAGYCDLRFHFSSGDLRLKWCVILQTLKQFLNIYFSIIIFTNIH